MAPFFVQKFKASKNKKVFDEISVEKYWRGFQRIGKLKKAIFANEKLSLKIAGK